MCLWISLASIALSSIFMTIYTPGDIMQALKMADKCQTNCGTGQCLFTYALGSGATHARAHTNTHTHTHTYSLCVHFVMCISSLFTSIHTFVCGRGVQSHPLPFLKLWDNICLCTRIHSFVPFFVRIPFVPPTWGESLNEGLALLFGYTVAHKTDDVV